MRTMTTIATTALAGGLATALASGSACAAPIYAFLNFDLPGAVPGPDMGLGSAASGINNAGQVIGFYNKAGNPQSFLRDPASGATTTLSGPPGAPSTTAMGINTAGQIVGSYYSNTYVVQGFLRDPASGQYTILTAPPGSKITAVSANGINNVGQIVGGFGGIEQGFLRDTAGAYTILNDPAAGLGTTAYGINDAGQIVGSYTVVYNRFTQGFLRDPASGAYATLSGPAYAINDVGQIVGTYASDIPSSVSYVPTEFYLRDPATGAYTTLSDPAATGGITPSGINDAGQIVGRYLDSTGLSHGFIATPVATAVPEPGSLALLGAGLAGLLGLTRRYRGVA